MRSVDETYFDLVKLETDNLFDALRKTNQMVRDNGHLPKLSDQDVNFLEIMDKLNLTEREQDVIFITSFYLNCFVSLNVEVVIMKKSLSPVEIDQLKRMYSTLKKYDMLHFLFTDNKIIPEDQFYEMISK